MEQEEQKQEDQNTEVDISTLDSDAIKQAVQDGKISVDDVVAYSEKLEADHKTSLAAKDQTILDDRLKKIDKLNSKKEDPKPAAPSAQEEKGKEQMDLKDFRVLVDEKIDEDSDEAKVFQKYKQAGIITSYKEGLNHAGVQAELAQIKEARTAEHELDGNADAETILNTKNDIYEKHKESGKEPTTDYDRNVVVEKSLEEEGYREY